MTLSQLKANQPEWFSRKNKRFFGDISYRVLHGKVSGEPFLVRSTYAWSDMFGQPKTVSWRINHITGEAIADRKIGDLVDEIFKTLSHAKQWSGRN